MLETVLAEGESIEVIFMNVLVTHGWKDSPEMYVN